MPYFSETLYHWYSKYNQIHGVAQAEAFGSSDYERPLRDGSLVVIQLINLYWDSTTLLLERRQELTG